ncbi:MAG: GNAT family N-acetyltransferase [Bradymonadales bacterium]|nr:MAG: GNAT family N-acetyltransferase [Bradymonadales bacterium]
MAKKSLVLPKLLIRSAQLSDIPGILELTRSAYPHMPPYQPGHIRGQINHYNEGTFVAIYEDKIVGYAASFLISEEKATRPHQWAEITGGGFNSRHEPDGEMLYGMEVCVHPDYRGLRIGRRLYEERKKLVERDQLKGIVIAGRIPEFKKRLKNFSSAEEYVKAVKEKRVRDRVLSFQLRNGFEIQSVLEAYLPIDQSSLGNAVLLIWRNPAYVEVAPKGRSTVAFPSTKVRITCVQYKMRSVSSFEEFIQLVEYFVDVASDYRSDFVVFPEWFTLQLLSIQSKPLKPRKAIEHMAEFAEVFKQALQELALSYNINIIGGSTAVRRGRNDLQNVCFVFLRDGSVFEQPKIHTTPNERYWWDMTGGSEVAPIDTDCGPIGVLICYDSEFPELVRHLVNQGARILFIPFCTDERHSYLRVRYCAQARAVENQIFVAMAGNVGNLPRVENMDIQYAQSAILTPCDFPFARDGIAADTTPNVETVAVADLRIEDLLVARNSGTVQNLKDRRHDLYQVTWKLRP